MADYEGNAVAIASNIRNARILSALKAQRVQLPIIDDYSLMR